MFKILKNEKNGAILMLLSLTVLIFSAFASFSAASSQDFNPQNAYGYGKKMMENFGQHGPRFNKGNFNSGLNFGNSKYVDYGTANWESEWHDPNEWINTGKTINAEQLGETLKYLYSMASVNKNFQNCTMSVSQPRECEIAHSCNCGKYGCSTCKTKSIRRDLLISCPDKPTLEFAGVCIDPRKAQKCGKYGCTPAN